MVGRVFRCRFAQRPAVTPLELEGQAAAAARTSAAAGRRRRAAAGCRVTAAAHMRVVSAAVFVDRGTAGFAPLAAGAGGRNRVAIRHAIAAGGAQRPADRAAVKRIGIGTAG